MKPILGDSVVYIGNENKIQIVTTHYFEVFDHCESGYFSSLWFNTTLPLIYYVLKIRQSLHAFRMQQIFTINLRCNNSLLNTTTLMYKSNSISSSLWWRTLHADLTWSQGGIRLNDIQWITFLVLLSLRVKCPFEGQCAFSRSERRGQWFYTAYTQKTPCLHG